MSDMNMGSSEHGDAGSLPKVKLRKGSKAQQSLSDTRTALLYTSIIAVLVLLGAFGYAESNPDTALFLMISFVFLGMYVFVGTMETTLLRNLIGLRASLVAWVILFAYISYVAKAKAVSEINSIFHIDATLLPMTLVAVTALQVMSMLFWPVIVISLLILVVAYLWREDFVGSHEGLAIVIALITSAVAQVFFALLVWGWVESGGRESRPSTVLPTLPISILPSDAKVWMKIR